VRGKELDTPHGLILVRRGAIGDGHGHPALSGDTSGVIFHAILERALTPPIRINPNIPLVLERIINKALEKDRDHQHASEMRADLKRFEARNRVGKRQHRTSTRLLLSYIPSSERSELCFWIPRKQLGVSPGNKLKAVHRSFHSSIALDHLTASELGSVKGGDCSHEKNASSESGLELKTW
jgi:hypothetical protein